MLKTMRKRSAAILCGLLCASMTMTVLAAIPYPGVSKEPGGFRGWQKSGEYYWYYDNNGEQIVDGLSADGYYLDMDGRWRYEKDKIFDQEYKVVDRYTAPSAYGDFTKSLLKDLSTLNNSIQSYLGNTRLIRMNDSAITYNKRDLDGKEHLIIGLYKDDKGAGWRMRLAGNLGDKSGKLSQTSTYDYLLFRYLLSKISHVPGYVSDGIYSNWQGDNSFKINSRNAVRVGDVMIRVMPVNGAADYYIEGV